MNLLVDFFIPPASIILLCYVLFSYAQEISDQSGEHTES